MGPRVQLLLLGDGLLGGLWTKCMFFKKHCSGLSPKSCDLRHYMNTWSATRHKHFVNYMDLAEQRTLGIEPGTSCIRGPILTNWAMHATSLWSSSRSLSCPPLVPLGKCCGQGSLTIEGNPLLQKAIPYYTGEITIEREPLAIIGIVMGKSYNKGFLYVVRSLTIRGNPLLYSKGFPYIFCLEISRRGFLPIVREFLLW